MVTEYIKRNQRLGYDENGVLVYKIPMDPTIPEEEELPLTEPE